MTVHILCDGFNVFHIAFSYLHVRKPYAELPPLYVPALSDSAWARGSNDDMRSLKSRRLARRRWTIRAYALCESESDRGLTIRYRFWLRNGESVHGLLSGDHAEELRVRRYCFPVLVMNDGTRYDAPGNGDATPFEGSSRAPTTCFISHNDRREWITLFLTLL